MHIMYIFIYYIYIANFLVVLLLGTVSFSIFIEQYLLYLLGIIGNQALNVTVGKLYLFHPEVGPHALARISRILSDPICEKRALCPNAVFLFFLLHSL